MDIKLIKASAEHQHVISNLMQFYIYDFSKFTGSDVGPNGLFDDYPNLEEYWKEENHRFAYVINQGGTFIGFVLVRIISTAEKNYFSIAEFLIMQKYRLRGIGRIVAEKVFNLHRGEWEIYQMDANKPAREFWRKIIWEYTGGLFSEKMENGRTIQCFSN